MVHYRLLDEIGAGAFGVVWRAVATGDRTYVAVKRLTVVPGATDQLFRFVLEQGVRLDHPHVVALRDWVHESSQTLLVMDLMNGGSAAQLQAEHAPLPIDLVGEIGVQVLDGLQFIHSQGVIHRDIKPENVLFAVSGDTFRACLSDFGCSFVEDAPRLSRVGELVGTVGYLAPEVVENVEPTPLIDVFSVGATLRQLITGSTTGAYDASVPTALIDAISTMTHPDPAQRYQTAQDAAAAVHAARPAFDPHRCPVKITDRLGPAPPDRVRRRRLVLGVGLLVGAIAATVSGWVLRPDTSDRLREPVAFYSVVQTNGNRLVTVGRAETGRDAGVWLSDDQGMTWSGVDEPALTVSQQTEEKYLYGVMVDGPRLIGVGLNDLTDDRGEFDGAVWTSDDGGVSWDLLVDTGFENLPGDQSVYGITRRAGKFVAFGNSSEVEGKTPTAAMWGSDDGSRWTTIPFDAGTDEYSEIYDVATLKECTLAVGGSGRSPDRYDAAVWRAQPDGSWTRINVPDRAFMGIQGADVIPQLNAIRVAGSVDNGSGSSVGGLWQTTDCGGTWSLIHSGSTSGETYMDSIQFGTSVLVVGFDGHGPVSHQFTIDE